MPLCPTCKQEVPEANMNLHSLHCRSAPPPPVAKHDTQSEMRAAAPTALPPQAPPVSSQHKGNDDGVGYSECPICDDIVSSAEYESHVTSCSKTSRGLEGGGGGGGSEVLCPLCFNSFPTDAIERHAASCTGGSNHGWGAGHRGTRPRSPDTRRPAVTKLRATLTTRRGNQQQQVAISVRLGDLTLEATDSIVNPANDKLIHGAGVAGAIARFGGDIIQDISNVIMAERNGLPIPVGDAVVTEGGRLPCKYVIHTVGPTWTDGKQGEQQLLAACVLSCLARASELSCTSIAIPAISSGLFGFPKKAALAIIIDTVLQFFSEGETSRGSSVRDVFLTNNDTETTDIAVAQLEAKVANYAGGAPPLTLCRRWFEPSVECASTFIRQKKQEQQQHQVIRQIEIFNRTAALLDMAAVDAAKGSRFVTSILCLLTTNGSKKSTAETVAAVMMADASPLMMFEGAGGTSSCSSSSSRVVTIVADCLNCRLDERGSFMAIPLEAEYSKFAAGIPPTERDVRLVGNVHTHWPSSSKMMQPWACVSGVFPVYDFSQRCIDQYRATVAGVIEGAWKAFCQAAAAASPTGHQHKAVMRLVLPLLGTLPPLSFPPDAAAQIILESINNFVVNNFADLPPTPPRPDALEVLLIESEDSVSSNGTCFSAVLTKYWGESATSMFLALPPVQAGQEMEPAPENETPKDRRARERRNAERAFQLRQAQQLQEAIGK